MITRLALVYLYELHTDVIMFGFGYSLSLGIPESLSTGSLCSLKCPDVEENGPKKLALYFLGENLKFAKDFLVAVQIVLDWTQSCQWSWQGDNWPFSNFLGIAWCRTDQLSVKADIFSNKSGSKPSLHSVSLSTMQFSLMQ